MALLPSSKLSNSALQLPDIRPFDLSRRGQKISENIYRHIKCGEQVRRNIFVILWDYIKISLKKPSLKEIQETLEKFLYECEEKFLNQHDHKYLKVFKALAAMDSSDMLKPRADISAEENMHAVLTVKYNAWKYMNDTEALAGMAVEITRELEGIMTQAQWLSTCWRNSWQKKRYTLWIEFFLPSLLALVLAGSFTWIAWVVFGSEKLKEWGNVKYAWPPAAFVTIVWTLTKSAMGILKPVSTQLMQYISFPDHTEKLGYQERVISDICFLKNEIGKEAYSVFSFIAWVITTFTVLWNLITKSCIISLLLHDRSHEKVIEAPKVAPASGSNLRIIVFVDDLDRCSESVILQVLSAVNLVLAVCEVSVVIGMDKRLIERPIIRQYEDLNVNKYLKPKQLADMYLQKIIQLQLDLPDPSNELSRTFLRVQLGVLENKNPSLTKDFGSSSKDGGEGEVQQNSEAQVAIYVRSTQETEDMANDQERPGRGKEKQSSSILIREMLFGRYSQAEENALLYFQELATDYRKLPREWNRFLNYHRLVWYIFSVSNEAKDLDGWQVQLIAWIIICWEWQENMNLVIQNWNEIGGLKTRKPSLLMIVEHLEYNKVICYENSEGARSEESVYSLENKLDVLEKSLAELRKEIKELKDLSDERMKDIKDLEKQVSDELKQEKKEIKEYAESGKNKGKREIEGQIVDKGNGQNVKVKAQTVKKESERNEEKWNQNWRRMKSTLEKYDVSMDGIQAFQRFRFYCIPGYLPRIVYDGDNGSI